MPNTIWREMLAGEVGRPRVDDASDLVGEGALLFHDGFPDRFTIPAHSPVYAGEERTVDARKILDCPREECDRDVWHFQLVGEGALYVAACPDHGWMVYQ